MARSRKKHKSIKSTLKFEVYGIMIIIFSIISLAGSGSIPGTGSVGRALSYINFTVAGELYFVVPLMFIYIGLFVMINRKWPRTWSYKKTGILLFVIGLLIINHISLFQQLDEAALGHSVSAILTQPYDNLMHYLHSPLTVEDAQDYKRELGGGWVGAFFYACLYFFFDDVGSRFMAYTFFLISFMLITGLSYVELGKKLKNKGNEWGAQFKQRLIEMFYLLKDKRSVHSLNTASGKNQPEYFPDEDEFDEENYVLPQAKERKKPLFFQLLGGKGHAEQHHGAEQLPMTEEAAPWDETEAVLESVSPVMDPASQGRPVIRDFQEHVALEQSVVTEPDAVAAQTQESQTNNTDLPDEFIVKEKPLAKPYQLPPLNLLSRPLLGKNAELHDYKANARKLEATLESFGVRTRVLEVVRGPSVTRYEIQPDTGVKVSRIVSLTDDIALALAAKDIRMEAPIPGKSAIGIEVPNTEVSVVTMREVMESPAFQESASKLSIVLGRDISGQPIIGNLARMPHLLVAGATGSGKSVCINGIITSILYKAKPDEVKFLMIDPKMVELNVYNGIPHLLAPVVTDPRRASLALKKVVVEMEKRYESFSKSGTRNIEGYNSMLTAKGEQPLPYIVVIVDELADLMMVAANDVEDAICRLAQMARAAGIHLIIATQRPSVDVITGVIKANIPSRIAFGVSSQVDSRTILDMVGAEKLLGRGDMLFLPVGASKPVRVQGAFLSDQEVEAIVQFASTQGKAEYREELVPEVEETVEVQHEYVDDLYEQAVQIVLEAKQASVSLLQRRMRVGYTRAARLIDFMEAKGVVGPYEGSKPREVLMSMEQYTHNRISS